MFGRLPGSRANRRDDISHVSGFANVTEEVAEMFLKKHEWNKEQAVNHIFYMLERQPSLRDKWQKMKVDPSLFKKYKDPDGTVIGFDGLIQLCNDMQIDVATDKKAVYMCWQMGVKQMGEITKEEWDKGFSALRVNSIEGLKEALSSLVDKIGGDRELFKNMYEYAFDLNLEQGRKKSLDVDNAIEVWKLLLDDTSKFPFMPKFYEFLEHYEEINGISRDHWNCVEDFNYEFRDGNLSKYDEDGAWPIIFDEFVEYMAANA